MVPVQLQKIDMSTLTNLRCSAMHIGTEAQGLVTGEKVCAIAPGSAGPCAGDSGGPLVNSRGQVVGVACWTLRPCGISSTAYVRVSTHLAWIQQNVV